MPGPATTLSTPSGSPASSAIRSSSSAVSGVSSAGLSTTVLPAASAGATFHEAITSGKFQGTISPTTPSGSRKVMSTPPATGIVSPEQALGRAGVVAEALDHHRRSRRGRRRSACRRCAPRASPAPPALALERVGEPRAAARARSPGATARQAGEGRLGRARPRRRSPRRRRAGPRPSPARSPARRPRSRAPTACRARAPPRPATRSPRLRSLLLGVPEDAEREARARAARSPRRRRRRLGPAAGDEPVAELGRRPGGGASAPRSARRRPRAPPASRARAGPRGRRTRPGCGRCDARRVGEVLVERRRRRRR